MCLTCAVHLYSDHPSSRGSVATSGWGLKCAQGSQQGEGEGLGTQHGYRGLEEGVMGGPALGESASLGSWGQAQQEGRLAGGGDTWWPAAGAAGRRPAVGRTEPVPSPYPVGRVLGVRGSACTLPIYRMEELGLHPADRQVYFGQLLGMCDQISFPLGEGPPRGGAGAGPSLCRAGERGQSWASLGTGL